MWGGVITQHGQQCRLLWLRNMKCTSIGDNTFSLQNDEYA